MNRIKTRICIKRLHRESKRGKLKEIASVFILSFLTSALATALLLLKSTLEFNQSINQSFL
jgi:hypothetical protein